LLVHTVFDVLALLTAIAIFRLFPASAPSLPSQPWQVHRLYLLAGSIGTTLGAYLAGSANLWITGIYGIGRSIEGAIAGGILAIEMLKWLTGIRGSTGLRFVAPLAVAIAIGRIGCFLAGLEDMTHGTPTTLPWGVDFGDGIHRHPVQLYEAATMVLFLVVFLLLLRRGKDPLLRTGFYLFTGFYAAQRFVWEFFKPYGTVIGPLNLFHLISLALLVYAFLFACSAILRLRRTPSPLARISQTGSVHRDPESEKIEL
jgi:prolipoprotein diacylglyceryltransferase